MLVWRPHQWEAVSWPRRTFQAFLAAVGPGRRSAHHRNLGDTPVRGVGRRVGRAAQGRYGDFIVVW